MEFGSLFVVDHLSEHSSFFPLENWSPMFFLLHFPSRQNSSLCRNPITFPSSIYYGLMDIAVKLYMMLLICVLQGHRLSNGMYDVLPLLLSAPLVSLIILPSPRGVLELIQLSLIYQSLDCFLQLYAILWSVWNLDGKHICCFYPSVRGFLLHRLGLLNLFSMRRMVICSFMVLRGVNASTFLGTYVSAFHETFPLPLSGRSL